MKRLFVLAIVRRDAAANQRARGRRAGSHFPQVDSLPLTSPNDKLATYGVDDPIIDGVACHFTAPEKGGWKGWLGLAEEVSDISLACRQVGPIKFTAKFEQGDDVFRRRRSLFFKKMQIVRGCDPKRNVLVYMVYSDRIIEGSPKNSTSSVPIMPGAPVATFKSARTGWSSAHRPKSGSGFRIQMMRNEISASTRSRRNSRSFRSRRCCRQAPRR